MQTFMKQLQDVLHCPLSGCFLTKPVVAKDGHTYQAEAIQLYFNLRHALQRPLESPVTKVALGSTEVYPNRGLANLADKFGSQVRGYQHLSFPNLIKRSVNKMLADGKWYVFHLLKPENQQPCGRPPDLTLEDIVSISVSVFNDSYRNPTLVSSVLCAVDYMMHEYGYSLDEFMDALVNLEEFCYSLLWLLSLSTTDRQVQRIGWGILSELVTRSSTLQERLCHMGLVDIISTCLFRFGVDQQLQVYMLNIIHSVRRCYMSCQHLLLATNEKKYGVFHSLIQAGTRASGSSMNISVLINTWESIAFLLEKPQSSAVALFCNMHGVVAVHKAIYAVMNRMREEGVSAVVLGLKILVLTSWFEATRPRPTFAVVFYRDLPKHTVQIILACSESYADNKNIQLLTCRLGIKSAEVCEKLVEELSRKDKTCSWLQKMLTNFRSDNNIRHAVATIIVRLHNPCNRTFYMSDGLMETILSTEGDFPSEVMTYYKVAGTAATASTASFSANILSNYSSKYRSLPHSITCDPTRARV